MKKRENGLDLVKVIVASLIVLGSSHNHHIYKYDRYDSSRLSPKGIRQFIMSAGLSRTGCDLRFDIIRYRGTDPQMPESCKC